MNGRKAALKTRCGPRDALGDRQRPGDRPVLGHQFADHHQDDGRQRMPITRATDGTTAPAGTPIAVSGPRDQLGERRLGEHADDQVGDGDAELGAGELEGQLPYGLEGAGAPRSPRWTARSSSLRSTVVSENSAATKAPQASESRIATRSRSTSVIGTPPPRSGRQGAGTTEGSAARSGHRRVRWEARPWADAHTFRSGLPPLEAGWLSDRSKPARNKSGWSNRTPVSTSAMTVPVTPVVVAQAETASVADKPMVVAAQGDGGWARRLHEPLSARSRRRHEQRIIRLQRMRIAALIDLGKLNCRIGPQFLQRGMHVGAVKRLLQEEHVHARRHFPRPGQP